MRPEAGESYNTYGFHRLTSKKSYVREKKQVQNVKLSKLKQRTTSKTIRDNFPPENKKKCHSAVNRLKNVPVEVVFLRRVPSFSPFPVCRMTKRVQVVQENGRRRGTVAALPEALGQLAVDQLGLAA